MARGRIISPDFWTDTKIIALTPLARLFFIGSWNFAYCGEGHLPDDALALKLKILPADQVDAGALLAELLESGRIVRVEIDGQSFLQIPTFARHQSASIDNRWKSRCPACNLSETHQRFAEVDETLATSHKPKVEVDRSRDGHEVEVTPTGEPSRYCLRHPKGTEDKCRDCMHARQTLEDWLREQKNRPTPQAELPAEYCRSHFAALPCPECDGTAVPAPEGWSRAGVAA